MRLMILDVTTALVALAMLVSALRMVTLPRETGEGWRRKRFWGFFMQAMFTAFMSLQLGMNLQGADKGLQFCLMLAGTFVGLSGMIVEYAHAIRGQPDASRVQSKN